MELLLKQEFTFRATDSILIHTRQHGHRPQGMSAFEVY